MGNHIKKIETDTRCFITIDVKKTKIKRQIKNM